MLRATELWRVRNGGRLLLTELGRGPEIPVSLRLLKEHCRVETAVCLVSDAELWQLGSEDFGQTANQCGLRLLWNPQPSLGVPKCPDTTIRIARFVARALRMSSVALYGADAASRCAIVAASILLVEGISVGRSVATVQHARSELLTDARELEFLHTVHRRVRETEMLLTDQAA